MEPSNPYAASAANPYGANSVSADSVSPSTIEPLAGTKPWVQFMSILMWLCVALFLFYGVMMMAMGPFMTKIIAQTQPNNPLVGGSFMMIMGVFYLVLALFYAYPAVKLWAYGSRIGLLKTSLKVEDLNAALHEQRRMWKFTGIMVIVMFVLGMLAVVGIGVAAGMGAMKLTP